MSNLHTPITGGLELLSSKIPSLDHLPVLGLGYYRTLKLKIGLCDNGKTYISINFNKENQFISINDIISIMIIKHLVKHRRQHSSKMYFQVSDDVVLH